MKRTSVDILPPYHSPPPSEKKVRMEIDDMQDVAYTHPHPNANQHQPNFLSRLVESDMYFEARQRSFTHPNECFPAIASYRDNLHQNTALGIACRKFSTKTCSNSISSNGHMPMSSISSPTPADFPGYQYTYASPSGKRYNTISSETQQIELIQALYRACPYQIRCNQMKMGRTPLLDCITNPNCTFEVRKFMIDGDCHLGAMDDTMAVRQLDSNRLLPLHHLINQVRRNAVIAPDNDSALKSMHYMIYRCPQLLNGVGVEEASVSTSTSTATSNTISPLIHLLSQKVGSRHQGEAFMKPIVACAKILLEASPKLIETQSVMSKCSPLHMALRNGYGDFDNLISLLLEHDPMGHQVQSMNMFGDLPVHVAATVGVKEKTWRLLLDHIIQVVRRNGRLKGGRIDPIVNGPCACIWSMNKKGLTPLHLMWMRHVNGDQVKYPNSSRQMGRLERDGFYHEALEIAIRDIASRKNDRTNLASGAEIASDVLGPFWDIICIFLQGTQSIMSPHAHAHRPMTNGNGGQDCHFLHAIYALSSPYLPRLFLDLGLTVFPDQVRKSDGHGRLPLHYACSSHAVFNEKIAFQISERNEGWKEPPTPADQPISLLRNSPIIKRLIDLNPSAARVADNAGLLPLAYAIGNEKIWLKMKKTSDYRDFCDRRAAGHCVLDHTETIKQLVNVYPDALERHNPIDLFEWFMVAAEGSSSHLDTVYYLLRKHPVVLDSTVGHHHHRQYDL